ncbi:transcription factor TFIIIB component B [Perkinsela sp. CCAP 1560/4]|nr:transcription factor TFIIIB component B [Perkinsela sp. CCAP 1560/4]KNH08414.1 transcription factor TFIIIB component B [Perkinsela sp. CCAP 1560/4]|eukprot:KNH06944.1 transcription factor TFIIIB component B [Perkinsela sp. CCAP 1560/4]
MNHMNFIRAFADSIPPDETPVSSRDDSQFDDYGVNTSAAEATRSEPNLVKATSSDYRDSIEEILRQSKRGRRGQIPKTAMAGAVPPNIQIKENFDEPLATQDAMSFEDAIGASSLPHTVPDAVLQKFKDGTDNLGWEMLMKTVRPCRKKRVISWSLAEKRRFTDCLQQFGLDFDAIAKMFPSRTRQEIRKAFKAIHGSNPHFVNQLLKKHKVTFSPEEIQACAEKHKSQNK